MVTRDFVVVRLCKPGLLEKSEFTSCYFEFYTDVNYLYKFKSRIYGNSDLNIVIQQP